MQQGAGGPVDVLGCSGEVDGLGAAAGAAELFGEAVEAGDPATRSRSPRVAGPRPAAVAAVFMVSAPPGVRGTVVRGVALDQGLDLAVTRGGGLGSAVADGRSGGRGVRGGLADVEAGTARGGGQVGHGAQAPIRVWVRAGVVVWPVPRQAGQWAVMVWRCPLGVVWPVVMVTLGKPS